MGSINEKHIRQLLASNFYGGNILFETDGYDGYGSMNEITYEFVSLGKIKSRKDKCDLEKNNRTKGKAEVFTPSWICNKQINLVDDTLLGKKHVFNKVSGNAWEPVDKVRLPKNFSWTKYVALNRMEATCGEAPYLVSRYDTVTGEEYPIKKRIGILDRKLRLINENSSESTWFKWAKKAFQSTYGFEWQGDSLLLARENLLGTFIDYYKDRFNADPPEEYLTEICDIISWNIFQMDGITYNIPMTDKPAYIKDWETGEIIKFKDLVEEKEPTLF